MHGSLSLHNCKEIRIVNRMPENANCFTLKITSYGNESFEITLYDLPVEATDKLEAAFGMKENAI